MASPKVTRCRTCDAPVVWCLTVNGRSMPVDAEPTDAGDMVLEERAVEGERGLETYTLARRADALLEAKAPKHVSHFATCPDAGSWRSAL